MILNKDCVVRWGRKIHWTEAAGYLEEEVEEISCNLYELLIALNSVFGLKSIFPHAVISRYIDECEKPAPASNPDEGIVINSIDLSWDCRSFKSQKSSSPTCNRFEMLLTMNGKGTLDLFDEKFAMDLSPIATYAHLPIKINTKVTCMKMLTPAKGSAIIEEEEMGNRSPTLYEVVAAILNEIAWFGFDDDKEKVIAELDERIRDIESGTDKLVSWDDFKEEFKENKNES